MSGDATFEPDAAVYVAAARLCFRHQLSSRRLYVRLSLLVVLAVAIGSVIMLGTGSDALTALSIASLGALGGLLFLCVLIGGSYLVLPRNNRRLFRQDQTIANPTRFSWDDRVTRWQSVAGSYEAEWTQHHGWAANDDVLIFFANERLYRFVPAAALSRAQREEIIERLEAARRAA